MKKIVVIDNYDSFVFNLVQYIGEIEPESKIYVIRNDRFQITDIEKLKPNFIVISPGPGRPENTGNVIPLIKNFYKQIPILGVCLGHQAIGFAFGAKIIHAKKIMHGKTSKINHNEKDIFYNIENPFTATRYHSLVIEEHTLPSELIITARSEDDSEIMGIKHKEYPVFGIQFHPESVLTSTGKKILKNFLNIKEISKMEVKTHFSMGKIIEKLLKRENLTYNESTEVMEQIMGGRCNEVEIGGFLVALRMKGETGEEIGGMAKVMRDKAIRINKFSEKTVDTCGTGGDGAGTFNISTATAFVVCSAGIPVAKHGNRSVSSKVGSADVLEAGGYILEKKPEEMEKELKETGFTFLFAPLLHPAMKNVMPTRKKLKVRTVFNILGPLTNPAFVRYQILGVFDFNFAPKLARALQKLGTEKTLIVSGGFTDELTTCGENRALLVTPYEIKPFLINLHQLGLHIGSKEDLAGEEDPLKAFNQMKTILEGKGNRTQIETVALNAGALLFLTGEVENLKEGVEKSLELLYSGKPAEKLEEILNYQKSGLFENK